MENLEGDVALTEELPGPGEGGDARFWWSDSSPIVKRSVNTDEAVELFGTPRDA